jgi:large subunit ribosomal protein L17
MRQRKLGRRSDHRQAMFKNMVTSLFKYGKIETTEPKAKEIRSLAEEMITLAKDGSLHSRRQAATVIQEKDVLKTLFDDIGPKYSDREGGYTRITKIGPRRGDAAMVVLLELV